MNAFTANVFRPAARPSLPESQSPLRGYQQPRKHGRGREEDEIALELERLLGAGLTLLVLLNHGGDEQMFGAKQQVPREGKC